MNRQYEVEIIETEAGLRKLEPEWGRLYSESRPRNPFLSFEWTTACLAYACAGARPFVVTVRAGERLAAVAPLRRESVLGFRVLRFIGDGRSDYLGFLTAPGEPGAQEAVLAHLQSVRGRWDLAILRGLCAEFTPLPGAALPRSIRSLGVQGSVAPYLALAGNIETSGPDLLRQARRRARRFERDGGVVERVTGPDAALLVDEISAVEAASWKGRLGTARFQPGRGQELLRGALAGFGRRDEMDVWLARIDGRAVAYLIHFLTAERMCYYQGAYREDCRDRSPGAVLQYHAVRHACEAGIPEYDFMEGGESYKAGWTNGTRTLEYRALFPDHVRGRLACSVLVLPRWRLKNSRRARAALQLWNRLKNNPRGLLDAGPFSRRVGDSACSPGSGR